MLETGRRDSQGPMTRRVFGASLLLMAVAGLWLGFSRHNSLPAWATGEPYSWWTESDNNDNVTMYVLPVDMNDWTDYMDESDGRLDDWLGSPPVNNFGGMYVRVSFTEPVTLTRFNTVVAHLLGGSVDGELVRYTAVGQDEYDRWGAVVSAGTPDANLFGSGEEPSTGIEYSVAGLVEADVRLGSGVDASDLDWVRDQSDVYLMDTTFIAAALEWAQTSTDPIAWFSGDAPWPDLEDSW